MTIDKPIADETASSQWLYDADIRIIAAIAAVAWPITLRAVKIENRDDEARIARCLFYPPEQGKKGFYINIPIEPPISGEAIQAALDLALKGIREAVIAGAPSQIDSPAALRFHEERSGAA